MLGDEFAVVRRNDLTVPGGYVPRARIAGRLSELIAGEDAPAEVVIVEADGTRHTDILHPPPPPDVPSSITNTIPGAEAKPRAGGFLPGEEVQLFQLVSTARADADGFADLRGLDADCLMFGAISGTVVRDGDGG